MEHNPMHQDVFAGQWKHIRGKPKSWWGKLADDDVDRIGGQKDKLIGVVQEKYGYAREKAQQEVERRLKEYSDTMHGPTRVGGEIPRRRLLVGQPMRRTKAPSPRRSQPYRVEWNRRKTPSPRQPPP